MIKTLMLVLLFPLFSYAQSDIVGDWKIDWTDESGMTQALKLAIASDGTFTVDAGMDAYIDIEGKYVYEDGKMTVWDTGGDAACLGEKKGVYQVTADAGSMTLTQISEECPQRGGNNCVITFERIGS